jgi:hypothetical protein
MDDLISMRTSENLNRLRSRLLLLDRLVSSTVCIPGARTFRLLSEWVVSEYAP